MKLFDNLMNSFICCSGQKEGKKINVNGTLGVRWPEFYAVRDERI